jgi:hypothetical protein
MKLCQIADLCVRETKAGALGGGANEQIARALVVVGIQVMPDDVNAVNRRELRRAMAAKYKAENKTGFVFSAIVLPIMISLISHWLVKWFTDHPLRLKEVKAGATASCNCRSRTADTATCTSSEQGKN